MKTITGAIPGGESLSAAWGRGVAVYRPTWVEIDRQAFDHNLRAIRKSLNRKTGFMAVVKANAYGHGAIPLSKQAAKAGAAMLGVSSLEEGIALREAGIKTPILIMGSLYPLENLGVADEYRLTPTISSLRGLDEILRIARRTKKTIPFHLKIDTGMGRVGVSAASAFTLLDRIAQTVPQAVKGIYMHFACADTDQVFTALQKERFLQVVTHARQLGLTFVAHAANSAAILRCPDMHLNMVRPGISLYGLPPFEGAERKMRLEPVLSWKTRIVFLKSVPKGATVSYGRTFIARRRSVIATLPVGYADGYDRGLSNRGEVLVRGQRCKVVGRVTMDMLMADVTDVKGAAIGDEAVLIGRQGKERITADEMAGWLNTISYEVTCNISYRVPRILI